MGKPGHTAPHPYANHLQEEPETKNYSCRNGHDAYKEKQKEQGQDIRSWMEDEISTQYSRDGSAGSYHRDL